MPQCARKQVRFTPLPAFPTIQRQGALQEQACAQDAETFPVAEGFLHGLAEAVALRVVARVRRTMLSICR